MDRPWDPGRRKPSRLCWRDPLGAQCTAAQRSAAQCATAVPCGARRTLRLARVGVVQGGRSRDRGGTSLKDSPTRMPDSESGSSSLRALRAVQSPESPRVPWVSTLSESTRFLSGRRVKAWPSREFERFWTARSFAVSRRVHAPLSPSRTCEAQLVGLEVMKPIVRKTRGAWTGRRGFGWSGLI